MFVYVVTNAVTAKRYIGITTMSVERRWYYHLRRCACGTKTFLYSAIRKYGESAFTIDPLLSLIPGRTLDDLFDLEQEVIAQEGTMCPRGYNMTAGGEGSIGRRYTEPQRAAKRGRVASAETRRKMSEAHKMRPPKSPETIAKTVATRYANGGYGGTRPTMRGRRLTNDHRAKLSAAWSPDRRSAQAARMSALRRNTG